MRQKKDIIILAIETSCDDTCVSVVKGDKKQNFEILSNVVSSQVDIHRKYGGVYPAMARREHQKNLVKVFKGALKEAGMLKKRETFDFVKQCEYKKIAEKILEREASLFKALVKFFEKYEKLEIDAIAVTVGPGLSPCLWVGVNFVKVVSLYWNLPIISVNHIEAHILANWLPTIIEKDQLSITDFKSIFPAICLIVSGGHTQLILIKSFGKYKILGETRDDAAGECLDKAARILGLDYPGGPAIAVESSKLLDNKLSIELPRPMLHADNYDFSFSGLKTAVLYDFKKRLVKIKKTRKYIQAMCAETQQAVIDVLIKKTIKATKDYNVKTVMLGGGVVANAELRKQMKKTLSSELPKVNFHIPDLEFCGDNAAMTGITGYFYWLKNKRCKKNYKEIKADSNLRIE